MRTKIGTDLFAQWDGICLELYSTEYSAEGEEPLAAFEAPQVKAMYDYLVGLGVDFSDTPQALAKNTLAQMEAEEKEEATGGQLSGEPVH